MIDYYIQIGLSGQLPPNPPWQLLNNYQAYLRVMDIFQVGRVRFDANSLDDLHKDFQFLNIGEYVYILLGEMMPKNDYLKSNLGPWYNLFEDDKLYHQYKGNYIIIRIDNKTGNTVLISSPLCVIPCNYCIESGEIHISSNATMIMKGLAEPRVDKVSLLQLSMFDTFLDNRTLIEQIKQVQYAERLSLSLDADTTRLKLFDHISLISSTPLSRKDGLDGIKAALEAYWKNFPWTEKFIFGLTGGFDCRLNLAYVPTESLANLASFTFGMKGNNEMQVSDKIAEHYKLDHTDVYLDEDYEENYHNIALEVLTMSDGFTPFMRCNYLYAHRKMAKKGINCVTGMYGSELIRPMFFIPDPASITHEAERAFLSDNPVESLRKYARSIRASETRYYTNDVYSDDIIEQAIEPIAKFYSRDKEYGSKANLYNFYLNEGMRKFFMEIMRIDRYFIHHYLPYLDLDFYEALMASEYAGVYNNMFGSLYQRRKGQLLYVDILKERNRYLYHLETDRGFRPSDHKNVTRFLRMTLGFVWKKRVLRYFKGNTTFNTIKWRSGVYIHEKKLLEQKSMFFNDTLADKFANGYFKKHEHEYARHFSIKKWLSDAGLDG